MTDLSFDEIVQAAHKLTPEEKAVLAQSLWEDSPSNGIRITRTFALTEFRFLKGAGAFENVESLMGKYARPDLDISEEELNAYLREVGSEWEQELDDLADDI